jgi:hypothetical protein
MLVKRFFFVFEATDKNGNSGKLRRESCDPETGRTSMRSFPLFGEPGIFEKGGVLE